MKPYNRRQELRAMHMIAYRVGRMSPAGRRWLYEWLGRYLEEFDGSPE